MTQLIENKPRRHALIATLSHFSPLPFGCISNRNIPRLETYLTSAKSTRTPALIATKRLIPDSLVPAFARRRLLLGAQSFWGPVVDLGAGQPRRIVEDERN